MRLNPLHPSDNPMEQVLYCFGGPDDTGGGSAGDFDDTVGTKVGGGARGDYQSQIEAAEARGEDVTFERLQQATGDAPATGGDIDRAAADRAAVQAAIEAARGSTADISQYNEEIGFYKDYIDKGASSVPEFDKKTKGGTKPFSIPVENLEGTIVKQLTPGVSRAERIQQIQGLAKTDDPFVSSAARATLADLDIFTESTPTTDTPGVEAQAQAQGMTQYGFNPAEQQIQAARGKQRTSDQTAQSIAEAAPTPERVQEDVPPSIRTMRGPTFSLDPKDEFQQFDETDYLDLGKIGPAPPKDEEDNRASDSLVERRERGIAAARADAAQNPLARSPDFKGIQIGDVNIPLGPVGSLAQGIATVGTDIYNTFANPTAKTIDNIQNKGHGAVYGAEGNLIGSVNPETGAVQATEGNAFNPELEPYFAEYRERQNQERERRGSNDPIIPPLIPEDPLAQDQAPEPVVGQNVITGANYQPREPVQFAYTGLPTLAPVSLQPTFQAQRQFTPTFGLGALRRS